MSIGDNWRRADSLNFAWFVHSPSELQDRYRDSGSKPEAAGLALQFEMRSDLRDRIADGEFIAFGIPIVPLENGEPQVIPTSFFAANSVQVDWDGDTISGLGRTFAEVRLCLSALLHGSTIEAVPNEPAEPKGRGGRRNLYAKAKPVLDELLSGPANAEITAGALLDTFNRVYVARYSVLERKAASVSERSLRTYLNRYRQESAKTGKN